MLTDNEKADLDNIRFAFDIVRKGQHELGLDYIDIAQHMQDRGFQKETINGAFSIYARKDINVV